METTAKTPPTVNIATPRTWVITGAAGGIGRCLVTFLLKNNQRVIGTDISFPSKLVQDLNTLHGLLELIELGEDGLRSLHKSWENSGNLVLVTCDLAHSNHRSRLVEFIQTQIGKIDVLVNNAAAFDDSKDPWNLKHFESVIGVNLLAPFDLIMSLRSSFHSQGSIVNLCSTRAHQSQPNTPGYTASKGGLLALTHSLAVSLGPEIRVNALSPGWIDTQDWGFDHGLDRESNIVGSNLGFLSSSPNLSIEDKNQHPAGRVGNPMDVIRGILYLTDPQNSFVTGQELVIDGGMTKQMIYHGDGGWKFGG